MVKDGIYYALGCAAGAVVVAYLMHPVSAAPFVVFGAFCLYFFRDPERQIPDGPVCVSPADGKVVHVRALADGRTRISIFLNIFDVHVNRSPIAGRVVSVEYQRGRFVMAQKELASSENEQNTVVIEEENGDNSVSTKSTVEVRQIAGLIARRIVCNNKVGDRIAKGERFGLIKFGSRTDVFLGPEWGITVAIGDRVAGGSSVLATKTGSKS